MGATGEWGKRGYSPHRLLKSRIKTEQEILGITNCLLSFDTMDGTENKKLGQKEYTDSKVIK
jgi:hypothetical protein